MPVGRLLLRAQRPPSCPTRSHHMLTTARASLGASLALLACTALPQLVSAQNANGAKGRPITSADVKAWNTIRQNVLSNDGKWFAYTVGPAEGDLTVVYRGSAANASETRVPVGATGGAIQMSGDSKWLGFLVTPNRPAAAAAGRGAAGGGRGAGQGAPPLSLIHISEPTRPY